MDIILPLFLLTMILILIDAAIGYHVAPLFIGHSPDHATPAGASIRVLLAAMVALYSFLACLAWQRGSLAFLIVVTGLVCLDLICLLFFARRRRRQG
jgi:hypothetical protein